MLIEDLVKFKSFGSVKIFYYLSMCVYNLTISVCKWCVVVALQNGRQLTYYPAYKVSQCTSTMHIILKTRDRPVQ